MLQNRTAETFQQAPYVSHRIISDSKLSWASSSCLRGIYITKQMQHGKRRCARFQLITSRYTPFNNNEADYRKQCCGIFSKYRIKVLQWKTLNDKELLKLNLIPYFSFQNIKFIQAIPQNCLICYFRESCNSRFFNNCVEIN